MKWLSTAPPHHKNIVLSNYITSFIYKNNMDWKINKYDVLVNTHIAATSKRDHEVPFVNDSVDWIWQSTRYTYELFMIIN